MALSEIEKLERRYAENPQGLTFAPLAEVHRKNGEIQRALDLLGPGLAIHPDYIPASIVLGRCRLDLGDVHAAEAAFLHVLSLDGENVIALKALADISERLLKLEDAERWLQTLLSVDRSNDEAREQLQRVETARRQVEAASPAEPDTQASAEGGRPVAADAEVSAPAAPAPEPAPSFEPPVAEPAMGWVSQSSQASGIPSPPMEELEPSALREPLDDPAGIQLEEPALYEEPVRDEEEIQPIEGLVGREVDVPDEFRVETSEDIVLQSSGGSEFQVPDASLELGAAAGGAQRVPLHEDAPVPPTVAEAVAAPAEEPVASEPEPEPELEPVPVPGDTVAFAESSVQVPDAEPETVPIDHYPVPAAAHAPAPEEPKAAPARAFAATETGGRPVAHFLKDILSARPPAQASAPAVRQAPDAGGGAPTRPAADALSLSSVFGEDAPGTPPAVPAPGPGTGVSFDDFFGAPGAAPAQRTSRAPDPKNDDLDQFHAWLQNLKR